MTKKDFELIASLFATRESEIEELQVSLVEKLACRFAHRRTVISFSEKLAEQYPRFNRGKFETWALPIYYAKLKRNVTS